MKQILAFESIEEYDLYKEDIEKLHSKWESYQELLVKEFDLREFPKAIVWTTSENATSVFSKVPVPAYTNRDTIYMTPSVQEWRAFHLSQLDGLETAEHSHIQEIKNYFNSITIDHVFCIAAHELTHHIELFPDEFEDGRFDSIWFEEGMCEYMSQKFTLTAEQFKEARAIDQKMIQLFKEKYGRHSLDDFGTGSYGTDTLPAIMLNYWRSSSAIQYLVEECHEGDIKKVFQLYAEWDKCGRTQPLTEFFGVSHF